MATITVSYRIEVFNHAGSRPRRHSILIRRHGFDPKTEDWSEMAELYKMQAADLNPHLTGGYWWVTLSDYFDFEE